MMIQLKDKRYTYQAIGDIFGISRQRVHSIITGYKSPCDKKITTRILPGWKASGIYNSKGLGKFTGTDFLAELVRRRDNYTCQICGKVWQEGQRRFDTHHLDEEDENNHTYENYKKLDRMITLCHKCHMSLKHIKRKMAKIRNKRFSTVRGG